MTPEDFVKIRQMHYNDIARIREKIQKIKEQVDKSIPDNLRPALPEDIQTGNVIWLDGDDGFVWMIIEEVLKPNDEFKAYIAEDGCRYGLDSSYVRKY